MTEPPALRGIPTHVFQTPATYTIALTAVGRGGTSVLASSVVVTSSSSRSGLVAAYSFDEGAGNTVADLSGHGNVGVITDVVWSNAGHFGVRLTVRGKRLDHGERFSLAQSQYDDFRGMGLSDGNDGRVD